MRDSISSEMEGNSMRGRLNSAGIFQVEALIFLQKRGQYPTVRSLISVIKASWSTADAGFSSFQYYIQGSQINVKSSLQRALWVEKLQPHTHRVFRQKRRPDKLNKKSSPKAPTCTESWRLSVGAQRNPRISVGSPIFFSLPFLFSNKFRAKILSNSSFFRPAHQCYLSFHYRVT